MAAPESTAEATGPDQRPPDGLVEAGVYRTTNDGFDHCLVVLALGEICWLVTSAAGYHLLVETAAADHVRAELARYDRESIGWPPRAAPDGLASARLDLVPPLGWALVVLAVFHGQQLHPGWTEAGALDSVAVFGRGEWWRTITALFLHADAAHLASNLFAGVFIFAVVLSVFGRVRGWLLLGGAAVAGNLLVAAGHYPDPYGSLGASTAVFAALGLLTGRAVRRAAQTGHPQRWRSFFAPLAAGLILLGLYGAGAPPVDVLAHAGGFATGAVAGFWAGRPQPGS